MAKYTLLVASEDDPIYNQGFSLSSLNIQTVSSQSYLRMIEVESKTKEVHVSYVEKKKKD